jgi:hypothetical protein
MKTRLARSMKIPFYKLAVAAFLALASISCFEAKQVIKKRSAPYTGPQIVSNDMDVLFTDSAKVSMKMKAKKQIILQSEDQEFPEGFALELSLIHI